jgi:hypothetical protein
MTLVGLLRQFGELVDETAGVRGEKRHQVQPHQQLSQVLAPGFRSLRDLQPDSRLDAQLL